jgi:hypothetical protein
MESRLIVLLLHCVNKDTVSFFLHRVDCGTATLVHLLLVV